MRLPPDSPPVEVQEHPQPVPLIPVEDNFSQLSGQDLDTETYFILIKLFTLKILCFSYPMQSFS